MLGGNWRSIIAVGGIAAAFGLLSVTGLAQIDNPVAKKPSASSESDQAEPPQPTGRFQKGKKVKPETYRAICDEPENKDYADLCQQWRQAESARDQVKWARRQYFATIGEIVALVLTLLFTGIAAIAAGRAVGAARDQVKISRIAMTSTERAFVFYDGMRWNSHPTEDGLIWRIRPRWINTGHTPTRDLTVQVEYWAEDQPIPDNFSFGFRDGPRIPAMLRPNGQIEGGHAIISGEELAAVKTGKRHFFVWGVAKYRDVFEKTPDHVTRFCCFISSITGDPLKPWDEKTNIVDLVFSHHPKHNCADEECEAQKFQGTPRAS